MMSIFKKKLFLLPLLVFFFGFYLSNNAAAQTSVTVYPSELEGELILEMGTNSFWTDQEEALWRERWQELGLKTIRIPLFQFMLEEENDDSNTDNINWDGFSFEEPYSFPQIPFFPDPLEGRTISFQLMAEALRDRGYTVMICPFFVATWNSLYGADSFPYSLLLGTYPVKDLAEHKEFLKATLLFLVNQIGIDPAKIILEVTNEPDLGCGQDPEVPCFWRNDMISSSERMEHLKDIIRVSWQAASEVNSEISIAGVTECLSTSIVQELMNDVEMRNYLDGLTYHKYHHSWGLGDGISRGQTLKAYGLPVYINEYGNPAWADNLERTAIWNSDTLTDLFRAEIIPIQFPLANNDLLGDSSYARLGLFYNWEQNWGRKPAYWVYERFYNLLFAKRRVRLEGGVKAIAAADNRELVILTTKMETGEEVNFKIAGGGKEVFIYNNLTGEQRETFNLNGKEEFSYFLPSFSSLSFKINLGGDFLKGDVNHDNNVNKDDVLMILNNWSKSSATGYHDPIGDSKVNGMDFGWVMKDWGI